MADRKKYSRTSSLIVVVIAYMAALIVGYLAAISAQAYHPLIAIGFADLVATVIIFAFSYLFKNSSIYDPYWSVIPIAIAIYFLSISDDGNAIRQIVVLLLVVFWGIRLTLNWARGWPGLHHQDWRYDDLVKKTGKFYWLVSFSGIHFFPTILVYLGCIPVLVAMQSAAGFGLLDSIAAVVTFMAILIEFAADEQLRQFRKTNSNGHQVMKLGLWSYSRHPNYFGEIMFWVGLSSFAIILDPQANAWTSIGAISMIVLFVFISIPMMDNRGLKRKADYKQYMREVSGLVPWFRQKAN